MVAPDSPPDLAFVHLSDVHFREGHLDDVHDPDRDLRNELLKDLRVVRADIGRLDAIIVTGDIAFGGKKKEFEFAQAWLETVREELDCPREGILTTPGNHDVDRDQILASGDIAGLHESIRICDTCDVADDALAKILRDDAKGRELLHPITAYNAFATHYGCAVGPMKPYWERDFVLRDNTILRVRGISTTLISGPQDDDRTSKLIYGSAQRLFLRSVNVRYMVAGHHPPSATSDGDEADRHFSERTSLQLFGHKHRQWIATRGESLRLISGALHPARRDQQWEPRYNVITIRARNYNRNPVLDVRVFPRRWSDEETTFIPDYDSKRKDSRVYKLRVPPAELVVDPSQYPMSDLDQI